MIKAITSIVFVLILFISNISAQEKNFEEKVKQLSTQIEGIVKTEKTLLRDKIKAIEKEYNKDKISFEEAEEQKKVATTLHAENIKRETAKIEAKLHDLVQGKVDVNVDEVESNKDDRHISIDWKFRKKNKSKVKKHIVNKRTRSYFVFALGFNNVINDGDINSINSSEFKSGRSHFYEVGLNYKTRLFEKSSLMYINYGLSLRYNNLRAKKNQYFVVDGDNTNLEVHTIDLSDSRMKNVQLVLPVFFEFDFSKPQTKKGKQIFKRNRSFRFGFGGFAGINLKTKQFLEYSKNGIDHKSKAKGDFNVNTFVYGVQGLIGYKDISLYVKYDMQDLFQKSLNNQKNISLGLRFDL